MPTLRIDHEKCTECRMCLIACEEIGINAVYLELEPRHRHEIDVHKCTYPTCVVCLMYCPAPGSIVEAETGRSLGTATTGTVARPGEEVAPRLPHVQATTTSIEPAPQISTS